MRITILATAALSIISITQAEYIIKIPMEQSQGGALPIGSIQIKPRTPPLPIENWQPAEAIYSEWANEGNIYDCSNWTPSVSTVMKDETFNQTATDCKQDQSRTKQDREQETTTLAYRNVGVPVSETSTITANSSRTATGTALCSFSRVGLTSIYWFSGTSSSSNSYVVYENGVMIKNDGGYDTKTFTLNGVNYTRGTTVKAGAGNYNYYEVCK